MSFCTEMSEDWKRMDSPDERVTNAYGVNMGCRNCGESGRIWVKKGILTTAVTPIECPHCGCKTMETI